MIRLIWQKGGEQNEQEAETSDRRGRKSPEEDLRVAGICERAPGSEEEGRGCRDPQNALTGIQDGTVIMEARPPAPDQEDITENAEDSALDKDGEDPAGWSGETSLDEPAERTEEDAGERDSGNE